MKRLRGERAESWIARKSAQCASLEDIRQVKEVVLQAKADQSVTSYVGASWNHSIKTDRLPLDNRQGCCSVVLSVR